MKGETYALDVNDLITSEGQVFAMKHGLVRHTFPMNKQRSPCNAVMAFGIPTKLLHEGTVSEEGAESLDGGSASWWRWGRNDGGAGNEQEVETQIGEFPVVSREDI